MSKRTIIIVGIIAALVAIAVATPKIMLYLAGNKTTTNKSAQVFFIKDTLSLKELAKSLKDEGIIKDVKGFISVGDFKGMNESNIALGKYIIEPGVSYKNVLNGFTLNSKGNGNAEVEVNVTFNNCRDIYQMAGMVQKCLMLDSTKLVDYLNDAETLNKYGFTPEQLPALFLPNTYMMYFDTDEKMFVERMAQEFKNFWTPERKSKLTQMGFSSQSELATLASIVYSEQSIHSSEWSIIAGLYLNRLKKGMLLQSDPTFKFCWEEKLNGVERLLREHRSVDCAYNTYKIKGLPPGPICMTSAKVLDAVLNYEKHDYLFMCAKPDFSYTHNFESSDVQHMSNARKYQVWLANELKKKKK